MKPPCLKDVEFAGMRNLVCSPLLRLRVACPIHEELTESYFNHDEMIIGSVEELEPNFFALR